MEYLAPLIQTILWVLLIIGILCRFHKPFFGILNALQKRIESGSNFKAGPFEIVGQLKPQDTSIQKDSISIEVKEVLQQDARTNAPLFPFTTQSTQAVVQERYYQVEDLVLRSLQNEFNTMVNRQVQWGNDLNFDGVFVLNNCLNIIEIKYVQNLDNINRIHSTLDSLINSIINYHWKNVQIILAIVFEKSNDLGNSIQLLEKLTHDQKIPVILRSYSYIELLKKFGIIVESKKFTDQK